MTTFTTEDRIAFEKSIKEKSEGWEHHQAVSFLESLVEIKILHEESKNIHSEVDKFIHKK